jgi:hypothetical protein
MAIIPLAARFSYAKVREEEKDRIRGAVIIILQFCL